MKRIKNYEEALNMLGKEAPAYINDMPKNEQAYHKLCTICEALNLGHEKDCRRYYPWWYLGDLRDRVAARSSSIGLGRAVLTVGSRLCCFDEKTTLYFGSEPFIKLWQEYLL